MDEQSASRKRAKAEAVVEQLIDEVGLTAVLEALTAVCGEKADHVQTNWGDRLRSRRWDAMGKACAGVAAEAARRGMP